MGHAQKQLEQVKQDTMDDMLIGMATGGFLDVKHYPKFDYNVEEKNSVVHTRENLTKFDLKADAKYLLKRKTKCNMEPSGGLAFA